MEYLTLQDIPHRQYDPLHSHRMASSQPTERPLGSMAAANAQMRSSPPIQPNEHGYADKLPSFSEFLDTTRAHTPPRTPSRRQGSSDSSPQVRPEFEDVAWQDSGRRRVDTLGDIYAPARPLHATDHTGGAMDLPPHSRNSSQIAPPYAVGSSQQHRPSYSYPPPHASGSSSAHHRHHSSPAPPPLHTAYRHHSAAPQPAYGPSPVPHAAYDHRQGYYQERPPPPSAPAYAYDHPQDAYYGRSSYSSSAYPSYDTGYSEVRFHHNVGMDQNSFNRKRRGNLPKDATNILKNWFQTHRSQPYPTEDQKIELCQVTQLTMNQVSNWFINARRRAPQKEAREREANGGMSDHH